MQLNEECYQTYQVIKNFVKISHAISQLQKSQIQFNLNEIHALNNQ